MWKGKNGVFKSYASLRIYGPGLDVKCVTQSMGFEPTYQSQEVGKEMWAYSSKDHIDHLLPLEEHVGFIIRRICTQNRVLASLRRKFKIDIMCFFGSQSNMGGFVLTPSTLAALGKLHLTFHFDGYYCI